MPEKPNRPKTFIKKVLIECFSHAGFLCDIAAVVFNTDLVCKCSQSTPFMIKSIRRDGIIRLVTLG